MRLSKIKLAGFKSFVDPTVLSFPSELDKQIDHLQRQVRTAEEYTEYKQEERLTRAQLQAVGKMHLLKYPSKLV